MRLGVYVGSFNPVHKGHIQVANYLLDNNYIDKIEIIPTGNYWDKKNLIDVNFRIEMLKFYESEKIYINETLNNCEYTYQVLNELKKDNNELYLIIGSDNLPNFHLWKNIDEILKNKVIVVSRKNIDMNSEAIKLNSDNFILVDCKSMDISSTKVRNLIKEGNILDLDKYLDKEVINYILKNKLYRR